MLRSGRCCPLLCLLFFSSFSEEKERALGRPHATLVFFNVAFSTLRPRRLLSYPRVRVKWSVLGRRTQSRRKPRAIGGSGPRVKNARERKQRERCRLRFFFFPSHPTLETLNPLKHPPKNKNKNRTPKPAPRPSAPSRPWERTPCSATLLQCSREERLREEQLGTPPREEQPRRARGPPAAPRGLAPPEEQRWER